jgi:hypothetical protein
MTSETTTKYQDLLNSCQAYLLCMIMENICNSKLILEKQQVSSINVIKFHEFFKESKHPILYFIFFFGVVIPF